MSKLQPNEHFIQAPEQPTTTLIDNYSAVHRHYLRAREFCGLTIDDIVNLRAAKNRMKDIWLLGCLVRKPQKSNTLPRMNVESWRA